MQLFLSLIYPQISIESGLKLNTRINKTTYKVDWILTYSIETKIQMSSSLATRIQTLNNLVTHDRIIQHQG